MSLRNKDNLV